MRLVFNLSRSINLVIIGIFYLNVFLLGTNAKETVPMLIWKNENSPIQNPAVSPLPVSNNILVGKYLQLFNSDNILLFLQDMLSVEDFSSHEPEFNLLRRRVENGHSLFIPAVEAKRSLVHSLSAYNYTLQTLEPGSSAGELQLSSDSKNLVKVKLPSTKTNPSRRKALQKTVEVIENVLSKIGKKANFTIIFTGEEPSIKLENEAEHRRLSRSLKQTLVPSKAPHFFHSSCVNLYLRSDIVVEKGNSSSYILYNNNTAQNVSDCQDSSASLIVNYKDLEGHAKVKVRYNFVLNERRTSWTFTDVELTETEGNAIDSVFLFPTWPMEHVPTNKSYTCSQQLVLRTNATDGSGANVRMIIAGMQVEAFSGGKVRFSDGWDCVGFFTIPIWTGIIAGILMTFILMVGMFMLSEVKTMDRFDDPKGKVITVTGSNE